MKTERDAFASLVRIITPRDHNRTELRRKLQQRKFSTQEIDEAFEKAERLKFLPDELDVAKRFAAELARKKGTTPQIARMKMQQRGFSSSEITPAVQAAFETWNAKEAAQNFLAGEKNADRAARKLKRRGFASDVIIWAVAQIRSQD